MKKHDTHTDTMPSVDLTNCDREPIHLLGNVQAYGCLISTSADLMVNHLSANCAALLGLEPEGAVGQRLADLLPSQTVHDLRTKLQISSSGGAAISRLFGYDVQGDGTLFDVSIHASGQSYIFEFEKKVDGEDRDDLALVQPLIARVNNRDNVLSAAQEAATALQMMSGFDRVMVYRFAADGSGEVIAERHAAGMEPFLGLRYPASDIPKQARELYKRSTLRLIADVDGDVSPIVPEKNPHGEPLDLSLAVTRAVSPIHLEYLRNMGVAASMSVSILKDGELWGLFACHHRSARYVDYERRTAIELFAQLFSYELERKLEASIRDEERDARALHDRLMVRLSAGGDLIDSFEIIADELSQIVASDGVAVFSEGRYTARGAAPTAEEFKPLARFLNTAPTGTIFATNSLIENYPDAEVIGDRVAGLIAVPISRTPRDYIVFFRHEIARSVRWAGNPEKPVEVGPNGVRLTPRKSFEAWTEVVRHTSAPWSESELRAAEALRISLIEIVLKLTDEASADRKAAAEKQELLIAELNHRVRNILNLIQGLVSQSKTGTTTVEAYTKVLDGRIQSLARAHDQLTRQEWAPTALRKLIEVEVNAFLNGQKERLVISGDAPMLAPEAFSTMALVVHELVTNSAKYGALADHSGHVSIDLSIPDDGALLIKWREQGGPPVQAPTRRGFGSTIIERTVPFELNGTVETRFKLTGFEADIMIPSKFVSKDSHEAIERSDADAPVDTKNYTNLSGTVLVLEDNMVIALDASDIITEHGATAVKLASSVDDALEIIANEEISVAVLDVNLGSQTSLPVAQKLDAMKIPFVLATGYGDVENILTEYPKAPVVQKPFTSESLPREIDKALAMVK
ncbi:HWE histidine kinase domain-containing protein [Roseobacter sp.]|uniref:HWE histidine kinase domain-containing protein n=1 Tax=Roseobacter sp. TaxID=1907202 RepID=UPI0029670492|nr:HWE histidine kinase domain-containing protein [Roseobacter sp.]MDW3182102.1 HWE histidine kinase domain-containing protein [Roseobacter sp.]